MPWNEAFVRDTEAGPVFIYRPAPFKDLFSNALIMQASGATDPGTMLVDIADVMDLSMSRTDQDVANWFWTQPGRTTLDNAAAVTFAAIAQGLPFDQNYPNNNPDLFGVRKMEVASALFPDSVADLPRLLPAGQRPAAAQTITDWNIGRGQQLEAMNRDNGVFEQGQIVMKGSELALAGRYVQVTRGGLKSTAYAPALSQSIIPFQGWTTSMELIRGDGFKVRTGLPSSPYLAEGRPGTYG